MNWLRWTWRWIQRLFAVLAIVRFSILIPVALVATLIAADQLADALIALSETGFGLLTFAFLATTLFAALTVWYTARTMFRFHFVANPASNALVHPVLKRHMPRQLAILVPGALLIKLLTLRPAVRDPNSLWDLIIALAVVTLLTGLYVNQRRTIARLSHLNVLAEQESQERRDLQNLGALQPATRWIFWVLIGVNVAAMLVAVYGPLYAIGAPALLLLGLGLTAVTGSWAVYLANHHRVPILTILVLLAILFSPFNDNHAVRQTAESHSHGTLRRAEPISPTGNALQKSPLQSQPFESYFDEWFSSLAALEPAASDSVPVVIVAADGGGIRAAYWTAAVLSELEDRSQRDAVPFSRHVFAISGVSGGSLGGAAFSAIAASRATSTHADPRTWVQESSDLLGRDFLSPTLANALFPDLLQRFIPVPLFDDRAIALEKSWERAWDDSHPNDLKRFTAAFHDLWAKKPFQVPLLFLNGTVVESGERAIMDPFWASPNAAAIFPSALRSGQALGSQLPLSTAVLTSARFTYISPAGLVAMINGAPGRQRIVDGGYFDNSGGVTAQEIIGAIQHAHAALPNAKPMHIVMVHIGNSPPNPRPNRMNLSELWGGRVWLGESASPVRALLNTRTARAEQAIDSVRDSSEPGHFQEITLYREDTDLPLGWSLSRAAQREMEDQLVNCRSDQEHCAVRTLHNILELVYGASTASPTKPY